MRQSLVDLFVALDGAVKLLPGELDAHRYGKALVLLREAMSAASKLFSRVSVLAELEDDAQWMAEVDRAVRKAGATRPGAVPGDQPLPFGDPQKPAPKRRTPPKKGGGA